MGQSNCKGPVSYTHLVYGVEIVPQAIEDAKTNAALNGITNAEFFLGKAEEVLPQFYNLSLIHI